MRDQATAIAILGMHRSGTSLFSKTVRSLGVYMGREEEMICPREDNPEGFWELIDIVDFHDRLLKVMSSSWDTTKPLPDFWWELKEVAPFKNELKHIVETHFSNRALWAWKDPRTCLTLPLWKAVLSQLNIQTRYIICLRNPLNVAASLSKRDRFSIEKSLALWTLYTLSSLYHTRDEARVVLHYDHLLESPIEIGQKISKFINIPYNCNEKENVRISPTPELRHGYSTMTDLLQEKKAATFVKELYGFLMESEDEQIVNSLEFIRYIDEKYRFLQEAVYIIDHPKSYRMQIYWADHNGEFSEDKSTYVTSPADGNVIQHTIMIKNDKVTKLRIDPIDDVGYVKITEISASSEKSSLNLFGSGRMEFVHFLSCQGSSQSISGIALNNDPQIVFHDMPPLCGDTILTIALTISDQLNSEIVTMLKQYNTVEIVQHLRSMDARLNSWDQARAEAAEKQREIDSLQSFLVERNQAIAELAEQFEKQLETLELLHNEALKWEKNRNELNYELEQKNAEINQLQKQLKVREGIDLYEQQLQEKQQLIRLKELEIERYQSEIQLYAHSLSWKITKPLRYVGKTVRTAKRVLKRIAKSSLQGYVIRFKNRKGKYLIENKFKWREYVVIVSHTNYLESMGGTEKYIYEQTAHLLQKGIGFIQIFPGKHYNFLDSKTEASYGVIIDGQFNGYYSIGQICGWMVSHSTKLQTMYTHHLLNWQYEDYIRLLNMIQGQGLRHIFFLHDFFVLCSSYHLMYEPDTDDSMKQRLDRRTCIPELTTSNNRPVADICLSCKHYPQLIAWREAIKSILSKADHIVAPSDFVKNTVVSVYDGFANTIASHAHLSLNKQHIVHRSYHDRKIKLAFLGYKMDNKGWALWERLYNNESLWQHYEFHHVGSQENYSKQVIMHSYSFITHGRMAAVDILVNQNIDLVVLWSIVPESYSYTFHEAVAAGVPVLTSPKSGNIAYSINAHPELGKVMRNEEMLLEFLRRVDDVRAYITGDRARYELEYNYLPYD